MIHFPKDFVWGAATASAQIEGAWREGGKSLSIWDVFSRRPGAVVNGDTLDVACDHYHRYPEDIALMKQLGLTSYRLSLAWPRILPEGTGEVNPEGIAFYRSLLTAIKEAGLKPLVTLYHWDLPQVLEDRGGWLNRDTIDAFARYADVCFDAFGDLVEDWSTFNEPWVFTFLGYAIGIHAPGRRNWAYAYQATHHVLVAHGRAVKSLRQKFPRARASIVINHTAARRRSDSAADRRAEEMFDIGGPYMYLDPIFRGGYDPALTRYLQEKNLYPVVEEGDFDLIRGDLDAIGLNYYNDMAVWAEGEGLATSMGPGEKTAMGWSIYAPGLRELLRKWADRYPGVDLFVAENGSAWDDEVTGDEVHDERRVAYLKAHLEEAAKAIAEGVPLVAYYAWSLLDNFEWGEGYGKRFGIIHVDYATQKRTIKDSGKAYAKIIKDNAV